MNDRRFSILNGIFLISLSVVIAVSVLSYSVHDACLFTASSSQVQTYNFLGKFGAYVSDMFIQCIGMISLLISPLFFIYGVKIIRKTMQYMRYKCTLILAFIVLGSIILTAFSTKAFFVRTFDITYLAGGFIGYILTKLIFIDLISDPTIKTLVFIAIFVVWLFIAKKIFFINFYTVKDKAPRILNSIKRITPTKKATEPNEEIVKKQPAVTDLQQNKESRIVVGTSSVYTLPNYDLLDKHATKSVNVLDDNKLESMSAELCNVLEEFGIHGDVINIKQGPVVTMFEFRPAAGIKTSRIISLSDDIARSMSAISARIAIIPGANAIGIELPNRVRQTVYLRDLLASETFMNFNSGIPLILGKDISGTPVMTDLTKMPHLLVAGTTGSGKSVSINDMILSILFKFGPEDCKLIMIDPKMLELSVYDEIPHLLTPVVTDPKKAVFALKWAVSEMENRYRQMSKLGVRNIDGFNKKLRESKEKGDLLVRKVQTGFDQETGHPIFETQQLNFERLPYIVIIVDEMADLMLVAGKDIEAAVQRLAQMARAAGIHLIMATQRPSVDVITGTIKANFPTRISFQVTSKIDSRTILGEQGAEQLLGNGDMLYMAGGGRITRIHGPFVKDIEVERVVDFVKGQGEPSYVDVIISGSFDEDGSSFGRLDDNSDDMYQKAVEIVVTDKKASISYIQRKLQIGYNRAARIVEDMEKNGVVSPPNHSGKREILI